LGIGVLKLGQVSGQSDTSFTITVADEVTNFSGSGFTFGGDGFPTTGVINVIEETNLGQRVYTAAGLSVATPTFFGWVAADDSTAAKVALFSGADLLTGSDLDDRLRAYGGDDTVNAGAGADYVDGGDGADRLFGGAGNDVIADSSGANYIRGEDGDDQLQGGSGIDDLNGNMGNDTVSGGLGDDWAVGGKDNDQLSGDAGSDVVWGNLGADTCDGGDGNDQVRGGQGDDSITGGAGNDYVSGDRGNDTISGGSGADNFHGSQDAGIDRVVDFNLAEGDRVQLDPGTTYNLMQVGADTVLDMGGGHQMILVGVQMSTLTGAWVFFG
jgi:Ca2+-binding RTX toxin-like protein